MIQDPVGMVTTVIQDPDGMVITGHSGLGCAPNLPKPYSTFDMGPANFLHCILTAPVTAF